VTRRIIPCGGRELFYPQLVDYVLSFALSAAEGAVPAHRFG
jgi:hypothetical protein